LSHDVVTCTKLYIDILFYRQCTYKTSHTFSLIALELICTVKWQVLSVTDWPIHVKAKCDAHNNDKLSYKTRNKNSP